MEASTQLSYKISASRLGFQSKSDLLRMFGSIYGCFFDRFIPEHAIGISTDREISEKNLNVYVLDQNPPCNTQAEWKNIFVDIVPPITFYVSATMQPITELKWENIPVAFVSPIILTNLSVKNFFLKHEIQINVDKEANGYILSNENLNVHVFGKTLLSAQSEWETILIDLYLSYRDTPDDQLTVNGKELKDRLHEVMGERNAD